MPDRFPFPSIGNGRVWLLSGEEIHGAIIGFVSLATAGVVSPFSPSLSRSFGEVPFVTAESSAAFFQCFALLTPLVLASTLAQFFPNSFSP